MIEFVFYYIINLLDQVFSIIYELSGLEVYTTYDVCRLGFGVSVLEYKHKSKLISRNVRLINNYYKKRRS